MNEHRDPFKLAVPIDRTDHVLGPGDARVAIVEYGDFECPTCAQAYHAAKIILPRFHGRVRFVFRHFPIPEAHPHAELAAEAAEAAGAQHRFWAMHDLLFENQTHLKPRHLRAYARRIGLDLERFDYELGDQVYRQRVNEQVDGGRRSGVRGTPTFFVDGAIVDVSFGIKHLEEAIEARLRPASVNLAIR